MGTFSSDEYKPTRHNLALAIRGISQGFTIYTMEASDVDWETINEQLVYDHSEESHQKRREIWNAMNVNDNKYLSLAEVDRGIRDVSSLLLELILIC